MKRVLPALLVLAVALSFAENGARLLIITTDALAASIQPLATWKQATGLSTRVVRLSAIGSDTGSIRNYIKNAYNNWPVRPEYVLLVGAPNSLPSAYYHTMPFDYSTDNIYSDMTGDFRSELPVGRLPARNTTQLDVMVAKTLAYEKTPYMTDSTWLCRLTTVCRENGDSDDSVYWNDIHHNWNLARAAGWLSIDSLSRNLGHSASSVVSSINAGRGIVMYRGDAVGNWYDPFAVNPASTANGTRLPVVLSATCATVTLTPNESMIGEAWLKTGTAASPRGAVAFIGNTHSDNNVARVRSSFARGFFDGLFTDRTCQLGRLLLRARQQLYTEHPSRTNDYRGFNLLGDPSLRVWTAIPRRLAVGCPTTVPPGEQRLDISVLTSGAPVESALACISMTGDTTVYSYGYTDSLGVVKLQAVLPDTGHVRLVVSGPNLYPFDTYIPIALTAVAEPNVPVQTEGLRLSASPTAFRGSVTLRWQRSVSTEARVEVYDAAGNLVRAMPVGSTGELRWNGRSSAGATVPAGTYFCRLADRAARGRGIARVVKLD